MRKSLIAALVLVASMALTGCGLTPSGMSPTQTLRTQSASAVEFLYLAPFRGSELEAGSEVIIAARIAFQLPQAGGRLGFKLMDERQRAVPLAQPAITLTQAQGETFVTFKVKVPTDIQRLTLTAPVTLPGSQKSISAASATFRVVADSPDFSSESDYRRIR
jgi:hypothetical protein